jgi:hypothetical protein
MHSYVLHHSRSLRESPATLEITQAARESCTIRPPAYPHGAIPSTHVEIVSTAVRRTRILRKRLDSCQNRLDSCKNVSTPVEITSTAAQTLRRPRKHLGGRAKRCDARFEREMEEECDSKGTPFDSGDAGTGPARSLNRAPLAFRRTTSVSHSLDVPVRDITKEMRLLTRLNPIGRSLVLYYLGFVVAVVLLGLLVDRYWLLALNFLSILTLISGGWLFWFDFLFPRSLFGPDAMIFLNICIHIVANVFILSGLGYVFSRFVRSTQTKGL